MKIGILTFHSQINYGGVLQCYALQEALKHLGHEVVVIDRWFSEDNHELYPLAGVPLKGKIRLFLERILSPNDACRLKRYKITRNFIDKYLRLTSYSFCQWRNAPKQLGIDLLIVGSDQVWNGSWQDPGVFLLEGAPDIPSISYAASFAMPEIPVELVDKYRWGFKRFRAISVREQEGVRLVESLGCSATKVVDPSQLLSSNDWLSNLGIQPGLSHHSTPTVHRIACYFIHFDQEKTFRLLESFAANHPCSIQVVVQHYLSEVEKLSLVDLFAKAGSLFSKKKNHIDFFLSAGPREFIEMFAHADVIISDSFHALMFASIFKKRIKIIRPHEEVRAKMFARIEEFVQQYVEGNVIADDLSMALQFLNDEVCYHTELLNEEITASYDWLKKAIDNL